MHPRRIPLLASAAVIAVAVALLCLKGGGQPTSPVRTVLGHGPTLVLVHGLGSRAGHWRETARLLARNHRVVMVELPGHGESLMPVPFSLDRVAESLDLALQEEAQAPVILVGHSVGGLVAVAEALAHPERVRALVLVETALAPQLEPADRLRALDQLDRDYRSVLHAAYLSFGRDSAQGERLYDEAVSLDSLQVKRWIRLALTADLTVPAAGLVPPTLAILSERSWPLDEPWRVTSHALGYSRIARLQPSRIPDCGHFIMLDQPAALARTIERFAEHPGTEPIAAR